MAFFQCHCFSNVLGKQVGFWAVIPQQGAQGAAATGRARRYPVLYLLHGLSDDHTTWMRRTSIDRYAEEAGIAVVMPAVDRSFYADMVHGYPYWTYISEELPALASRFLPLSTVRADTYVAGLSMGGYGAFKLALSIPRRFAAAASLSGALDLATRLEGLADDDPLIRDLFLAFGDPELIGGSDNDLLRLAHKRSREGESLPFLYQWCGTEDFLYSQNIRFRDHARKLKIDLLYEEGPGGHEWKCWDVQIGRTISWIRQIRRARRRR